MKLKHHAKIWLTLFKQLPVAVVGLLVVPVAYLMREGDKLPTWAWAWDNDHDGIYTDNPDYRPSFIKARTMLDAYYWLAIRNPARNFSAYLGFTASEFASAEVIQCKQMDISSIHVIVTTENGKEYPFYYLNIKLFKEYRLMFKYGWKNCVFFKEPGCDIRDLSELDNRLIQFVFYPQIRKSWY